MRIILARDFVENITDETLSDARGHSGVPDRTRASYILWPLASSKFLYATLGGRN